MDFRILDASAFYAGVPFRSSSDYYTTSLVYDEISHIKKNHGALEILLETNRLKIREPESDSTKVAVKAAKTLEIFHNYQNKIFPSLHYALK